MDKNKYSLKRKVTHISIENEDGQGATEYELREMPAGVRDGYLDRLNSRVRIVDGKSAGVAKFQGLQADLISSCLFAADGKNVTAEEIQKWPAGMVADIFKQAQDLNQLGKEDEASPPKNG